jgi:5-methylthioadenosine/S-adenosylhomocysteine deaminase
VLVEPTGLRAAATLADVLGPELLCAHCVHLDGDEIGLLARLDVPVAHCPRSNALLGCGIAPVADMRTAGLRVGLGTDSPASTPSFDVWEELRSAVYLSRAREQRPDALDGSAAIRLATLDAARAIGLEDEVGSLTPGKRADLTVVSIAGTPYDPVEDPEVAAVFGGSPAGILETIVDGTTRYRLGETAWHEVRSTASGARRRMLA